MRRRRLGRRRFWQGGRFSPDGKRVVRETPDGKRVVTGHRAGLWGGVGGGARFAHEYLRRGFGVQGVE